MPDGTSSIRVGLLELMEDWWPLFPNHFRFTVSVRQRTFRRQPINATKARIADLNAIFPFRKSIKPNHFEQYLLQK